MKTYIDLESAVSIKDTGEWKDNAFAHYWNGETQSFLCGTDKKPSYDFVSDPPNKCPICLSLLNAGYAAE